jgi:thymidylate kinase
VMQESARPVPSRNPGRQPAAPVDDDRRAESEATSPLVRLVDALVEDRVLVFGSLPPRGRDLDLLVRSPEAAALDAGLEADGFARHGSRFARFHDCSAEVVELKAATSWRLPDQELRALFSEAEPLAGTRHVVRPAPHHALLITARRAAGEGGTLRAGHGDRIRLALEEDPAAFERAFERSAAWGASRALSLLEDAYRSGTGLSAGGRIRAALELERGRRTGLQGAMAALRRIWRPPRLGAVVALSGLDGCGKTTQAKTLEAALHRLGYDTVRAWISISALPLPPWLEGLSDVVARAMSLFSRPPGGPAKEQDARDSRTQKEIKKQIRRRSSLVTFVWSLIVLLHMPIRTGRVIWPAVLRGRVVVCDRYVLDSAVHLRYKYGEARRFGLQTRLLQLSGPAPLAFILDLPPEEASVRKADYDVTENTRRAAIYRAVAEQLGARRIDAELPRDQICTEVARTVWDSLEA